MPWSTRAHSIGVVPLTDATSARAVPQEQRDEGQVTRDARHVQRRHGARPVVVEAEPRELRLQQPRQHAPRPRVPRAHEIRIRKRACGDRPT